MMNLDKKLKEMHVQFLLRHLEKMGPSGSSSDTNRLTILFFALSGLDLLHSLDSISETKKNEIIEWIYLQQLHPNNSNDNLSLQNGKFGFRCSSANGNNSIYDYCNLAMTYSALASLVILGDNLSRVNRSAILQGLKMHQKSNGSFVLASIEEENDLRITYCAATICFILNDWSFIDQEKMIDFIKSCLNYENGFGQSPGTEAHGGPTFCALASLFLMKRLNDVFSQDQIEDIIKWCLQRQVSGFQGRPYKDPDTCYSFWVGASLSLLCSFKYINDIQNQEFLYSAQNNKIGGFGKYPDSHPEILHTFFGLSALSLRLYSKIGQDTEMQSVFPALNISERAYQNLLSIHEKWNNN